MKKFAHKIIFSSGYAYGSLPTLDSTYDIVCVRGPLTAQALKIDQTLAITDGAALLREFKFQQSEKKYEFSFMPHFESEMKYRWKDIALETGVNYVSPLADPLSVINEILKSRVVIAEAMHFAIVADVLRVPWIAVKAYPGINDFKWRDWTQSLNMTYHPVSLAALFEGTSLDKKLRQKTRNRLPSFVYKTMTKSYLSYQKSYLINATIRNFEKIMKLQPQLSNESTLTEKSDRLLEKLEFVKRKYQRHLE